MEIHYQSGVSMGSERNKIWTVEKAENAAKATFFMRFDAHAGKPPKLSYTEIKETIAESNPIGDTTLTRALDALRSKGELGKEGHHKDTRYSLKERPRADLVAVSTSADRMAIENAAQNVGAISDTEDGWAFYGVPAGLSHRLRPRLRREAWKVQDRVDRILQAEVERFIKRLLRRAKGRLTKGELEAAERGIRYAFDTAEDFRLLSSTFAWTSTFLDRVAPGAIGTLTASWEKRTKDDSRALLRELAKISGEPEDRIENAIKKGLEREQRHQKAGRKLFDALPPRERERAAREFADLAMLSASWCAVVR